MVRCFNCAWLDQRDKSTRKGYCQIKKVFLKKNKPRLCVEYEETHIPQVPVETQVKNFFQRVWQRTFSK